MPITVTAPRGVLAPAGEREILPRLTTALAEASGLADNKAFLAFVGGTVHVLPAADVYAGGENRPVIMVELKLPNIGLPSIESRAAFVHAATDVVDELTGPDHLRENTWVNILNAPEGGWGIGGRALTGEQLVAEITGSGRF
ncbi:4-oxalocrotonate tautomerase family protein [Streptacidiphilus sp. EB103A]|uniref:tautomerase family protein n=1 Tax=Streptacidiphilus sp. EB103A TaxID=3156275 RepID=UPI0035174E88